MCAIAGILSLEAKQETLDGMLKTMTQRGPDASGIWQQGQCALLHSRLAIIDPVGGAQPMELHYGGEHYVLVYNGELYNTEELRCDLKEKGYQPKLISVLM